MIAIIQKSIENSIFKVFNDKKFKIQTKQCKNLYQSKNTSKKIVSEILIQLEKGINIQKQFYDKKK